MKYLHSIGSERRMAGITGWENGRNRAETLKRYGVDFPIEAKSISERISQSGTEQLLGFRLRRSPCWDELLTACRGMRESSEQMVTNLIKTYSAFFATPSTLNSFPQVVRYRTAANLEHVLESGLLNHQVEQLGKESFIPNIISGYDESDRQAVLDRMRGAALQHASTLTDSASGLEFAVDLKLAQQLTGYPFERPADIIRNYGARLIEQGLIAPDSLEAIAHRRYSKPLFLGSYIPPEAIIGVYQGGKCIWRRPDGAREASREIESDTRYERILNVAIGTASDVDKDVALAQRYLHRKHPSKTDNYILRPSEIPKESPIIERTTPVPSLPAHLYKTVRIHIVGNHELDGGTSFGEAQFDQLCEILPPLVAKWRRMGAIGLEPVVSVDWIACGAVSEQQVEELRAAFRKKGLPAPSVTHRAAVLNEPRENLPSDLHLVLGLAPDQLSVRTVQKLKKLHPSAFEYNLRKPGPNVRSPLLYQTFQNTDKIVQPPVDLRINIIGHGSASGQLKEISFEALATELADLVYKGQQTGEFNAEAKVTLNFVACKVSADNLGAFYQAFQKKNIRLVRSIHRNTELMVDTAGRKLQLGKKGEWQHGHLKEVFEFDENGKPKKLDSVRNGESNSLFSVRNAAGPLAAAVEARYHIDQVTNTLDSLKRDHQLGEEWRPHLESLVKTEDGNYRINFRRGEETFSALTQDKALEAFNTFAKRHADAVGENHQFDNNVLSLKDSTLNVSEKVSHANRLLGSISALRTLMDFGQQSQSSYAAEMRAHMLVNVAQSVQALGNEGVSLAENVRRMFNRGPMLEGTSATKFIGNFDRMVGRGFLGANIGFDIYELTQASTPEEKLRSSLSLAFDGAVLGIELASGLGVLSAATGPLGLLLGLGALAWEIGSMVNHHRQEQSTISAIYHYFENLKRAYTSAVRYDAKNDLLSFSPGAVISSIRLTGEGPRVDLGSQKLAILNQYRLTCWGKGSTDVLISDSEADPKKDIDIRNEMRWPNNAQIAATAAAAANILLPASPIMRLNYRYYQAGRNLFRPGAGRMGSIPRHDSLQQTEGYRILQELAQKNPDFLFSQCGAAIDSLQPVPETTLIQVSLGQKDRTLLMPPNLQREIRQHLKYTLEGAGGCYRLFPARDVHFSLRESGTAPSTWIIDLSEFEGLDDFNYTIAEKTLIFHDPKRGPIQIDFSKAQGSIQVHTKLRTWQLSPNRNSLLLTYMNCNGVEIPLSEGSLLQGAIKEGIKILRVLRSIPQLQKTLGDLAFGKILAAVFKNHAIQTSDYVRLDHIPTALSGKTETAIYNANLKSLVAFGGVTNSWLQNGTTFVSQALPLRKSGETLEAIYRFNGQRPELVKLIVPWKALQSELPSGGSASASDVLSAITKLTEMDSFLLKPTARYSDLILLICRDKENKQFQTWLNTRQNELMTPDQKLPLDAVPIAVANPTPAGHLSFFYSDSAKALYRSIQTGGPFSESRTSDTLITNLCELKLQDGRLRLETQEGAIYEVTAGGDKKMIAVSKRWLSAHSSTWATDLEQLCQNEPAATQVEVRGLQVADGRPVSCWYNVFQKQFTVAPQGSGNEKLLYLGRVSKEGGAWWFQSERGRLYQQPTFTSEWIKLALDGGGNFLPLFLESAFSRRPASLRAESIDQVRSLGNGRLIAVTQSGLTLLLESNRPPLVLAVNQKWLSQENDANSLLAQLVADQNYRFYWKLSLPKKESQSESWYDVAARQIVTVSLKQESPQLHYIGYAEDGLAYLGNQKSLVGLATSGFSGTPVPTRFQAPSRNKNILSLQMLSPKAGRSNTPPVLAGINTLALYGNTAGLVIDQSLWSHHRLISLNRLPFSRSSSHQFDQLELHFNGADNLMLRQKGKDLVLKSPSNSPSLIFDRFFEAGRNWNLSLKLPDGTRRKLEVGSFTPSAGNTKFLKDLPLATGATR